MPEQDQRITDVAAALMTELRDVTGRKDLRIAGELHRMTGGFDTDTYTFELENAPGIPVESLVLRHYREAAGSDRPDFESTVQNAVALAGHLVPAVPYDTSGRSLLGRAYMLMQRMPGASLLETMMADPMGTAGMASKILGTTQAALHELETGDVIRSMTSAGIDPGQYAPFRQQGDLSRLAAATGDPVIAALTDWLSGNRPGESELLSICHGDFHPGNVLVEDGRVTGVVDWGNFTIGPAEYDVAITRFLISIGPIEDVPIPREQIDALLRQFVGLYDAAYAGTRRLDEGLIDFFTVLRVAHAMGKVLAGKHGAEIPGIAHEGYAWGIPVVYELMRRRILEITAIDCGARPTT